jgi:hypothetical protein
MEDKVKINTWLVLEEESQIFNSINKMNPVLKLTKSPFNHL